MSGKGKKPRNHPGVRGPRPDRKEQRRQDAAARAAVANDCSPRARIAILDARLGKGVGAKRERARLAKLAGRAA